MKRSLALLSCLLLVSCGGGSGGSACDGSCATATSRLEIADVEAVIARAVHEAQARGETGTVAVVDRVGNVLGVFRMNGAATAVTTDGGRGVDSGLDGIAVIPDHLAAIAKAVTGAYLSSEGNAFTTRTASQIVQEHFNPGESGQPGGPLFGVQFSSLPCSDLSTRLAAARPSVGPHRSPLGLSADPGGLPLYKNGTPVGGVGVIVDGVYGLDVSVADRDLDDDEIIALAATTGFEPPADRRADRITVDGKTFRYTDARTSDFAADPAAAPAFAALDGSAGIRLQVPGYTDSDAIVAGTVFGQAESGYAPAAGALGALDAFVLVDGAGNNRFPATAGTDAASVGADALTAAEVQALLEEAVALANRSRAQIRRPLGSSARVTISVVDTHGAVLGIARTRDGPVFGTDVSLQKARTATFFSNAAAADDLRATPDTTYLGNGQDASIADYVDRARAFLGSATALGDGAVAFSDRAGGNLSRPFYPDGLPGRPNGPFSRPIADWSAFSVGLQLDLVNSAVLQHVTFVLGAQPNDVGPGECTQLPATASGNTRLPNGIQIFPGSVPIYRGNTLVGGIGVSGDGVDQDDMISFLAVDRAGQRTGTIANAPPAIRADQLEPQGIRLRYVQCPQSPFIDSDEQHPCNGR